MGVLARLFRPRVTIFDRLFLMAQGLGTIVLILVAKFVTLIIGSRLTARFFAWANGKAIFKDIFGAVTSFRHVSKFAWEHMFVAAWHMKVKQGTLAYNAPLIRVPDGQSCMVLDFQTAGKPLVVFFASCTCPFVIAMLGDLSQMIKSYKDDVDFLFVYTTESHPSDGWKLPNPKHNVASHRNLKERLQAAEILQQYNLDCHIAVDLMDDGAVRAYCAAPDRLYMIQDGVVIKQSKRGPHGFDSDTLQGWLQNLKRK